MIFLFDIFERQMLEKSQQQALGIKRSQTIEHFIWNPKLGKVYEEVDEQNLQKGDGSQTFPEFLEMEKREPNEEGTGRFKLSHYNKIDVIFILKKDSMSPSRQLKTQICSFLSIYLRLKCVLNTKIRLEVDKHKHIVDKKTGIFYKTKSRNGLIDSHDILSVLMEYQEEKTILLALIEIDMHQYGFEIDGRAYGDGVATVSYNLEDLQDNIVFFCQTSLHEALHTLGFDHCLAWKCLMNAITNFQSWLCPACSRKLYHELGLTSAKDTIIWMKQILQVLGKLKAKDSIKKGQKIIKYME